VSRHRIQNAASILLVSILALSVATGCTFVGQGEGQVHSDRLVIESCWSGAFDLNPDFFAAIPYRDTLQIRAQRGSDLQEVSDGVAVLVNDVASIRNSYLGQPLEVGLAPKLRDELAPKLCDPSAPDDDLKAKLCQPKDPEGPSTPPPISLALYLQFSCHNQNVVLYAITGEITFQELFSGDPNESVGSEKLTDASFDVLVADPRDADPAGTLHIPPERISRMEGDFRFHFQRGKPGQPFP